MNRAERAAYMRAWRAGNRTRAREISRAANKLYRDHDREWYRIQKRASRHRLTIDEIHAAFEAQGERCRICRRVIAPEGRATHIDHDHRTGRFRGLLCHACNRALGLLRDDPALLRTAADYVAGAR